MPNNMKSDKLVKTYKHSIIALISETTCNMNNKQENTKIEVTDGVDVILKVKNK